MRIVFGALALTRIIFTGLIVGARQVGQVLPEPTFVRQLRLSDCALPCWIGIVPGTTRTEEAIRRFTEAFAPSDGIHSNTSAVNPSPWIELALPTQDAILVHLELVEGVTNRILIQGKLYGVLESMPRVGDVVSLFGAPSCANPQSPGFMGWSLFYDNPDGVVGVLGRDSIAWTQPVYFMYMRPRDAYESCSIFQPWRGLNRNRYQQAS